MKPKSAARRCKLSPGVGAFTYQSGRVACLYSWTGKGGRRQVPTFNTPEEAESFRSSVLSDGGSEVTSHDVRLLAGPVDGAAGPAPFDQERV